MPEISFSISNDDFDRLYAIKDIQGKRDYTGNDLAKELLENELRRLYPPRVKYDDNGTVIDRQAYRGGRS